MFKNIARKPIPKIHTYLKYGFITEHDIYICPRCRNILNAGPDYQPQYCDKCGQRVTFKGIKWREDREKGYIYEEKRGEFYESLKDRVV